MIKLFAKNIQRCGSDLYLQEEAIQLALMHPYLKKVREEIKESVTSETEAGISNNVAANVESDKENTEQALRR